MINPIKFLQIEEGNFWIFESYHYSNSQLTETTNLIKSNYKGIKEINGKNYYRLMNTTTYGDTSYKFYRIDFNNRYLYEYSENLNQESLLTILTSESGQYNIDYENYPNDYLVVTISQTLFNRFEDDIMVYKHLAFNPETQFGYIFSEKYGWIDYQRINIGGTWSRTYLGCYINAIAYGDTSFNQNK